MKTHNRVIQRQDKWWLRHTHPSSWDDADNDLSGWALYALVEDSVLRITYIDKQTQTVKYDWVTSTDFIPDDNIVQDKLQSVIQIEGYMKEARQIERDMIGTKPWKIIRRI